MIEVDKMHWTVTGYDPNNLFAYVPLTVWSFLKSFYIFIHPEVLLQLWLLNVITTYSLPLCTFSTDLLIYF